MWKALGYRAFSRTAHPAEIRNRIKSGQWKMTSKKGFAAADTGAQKNSLGKSRTTTRMAASFEFTGAPMAKETASQLFAQ